MKSLITGGAGFIGSHVAAHCRKFGHEVVILDDLSGGFLDNLPESVEFIKGSVADRDCINRLFEQHHFDYVYHLAAYAAEGLSHFIRHFNYNVNLIGSVNLLNASVNSGTVKRFIFSSSIAVYGNAKPPMTEDTPLSPQDPYGISKAAFEMDLKCAHDMFGLDYTIFRPHNVYGDNQNIGDRYRNVIGIFINQVIQNKPMTIFGDGLQTRAFSHIDDVAPTIARCINVPESANETFNIGADQPYTVRELAETVAAAFGVSPNILFLEARHEVQHAFSSHDKCIRVFGTQATIGLEDGVQRMVEWAKIKGARHSKIFQGIEVYKNMPEYWRQEIARAR